MTAMRSREPAPPAAGAPPEGAAELRGAVRVPPTAASDADVLQRLRAGDPAAFTELLACYHGALLRLALAYVSSRAVAEEVVQETWVGVLDGLGAFEGRSSLKTWIFRILANRAKTRGLRERRSVPFSGLSGLDGDDEPSVPPERFRANGMWGAPPRRWEDDAADQLSMNRQALGQLERALAQLPPNQRVVVTLRDLDGLDAAEVCNVLGITETNQRVLLHRARAKLRATLEDFLQRS